MEAWSLRAAIKESQWHFPIVSRSALCRRKYVYGIYKSPPFVAAMPAPDLSQLYLNNPNLILTTTK